MGKTHSRWPFLGACSGLLGFALTYKPVVVQGHSMQPTLRDGQMVWMDCAHYRWRPFHRGDVVIFHHDNDVYVKRVFARAGDAVDMARFSDGSSMLMDDMKTPARLARAMRRHPEMGRVFSERVPPDKLFVVGDNRNNSMDSRDFGPISASDVMGFVPASLAHPFTPKPEHLALAP